MLLCSGYEKIDKEILVSQTRFRNQTKFVMYEKKEMKKKKKRKRKRKEKEGKKKIIEGNKCFILTHKHPGRRKSQ